MGQYNAREALESDPFNPISVEEIREELKEQLGREATDEEVEESIELLTSEWLKS